MTHFPPSNTDSSRLSSTPTCKKLSHCMTAFCLSLPMRVFYTCAVRCNMRLLLPQHFRTPVTGKRKRRIQEHISGSCLSFVYFSDLLLALQQRSPGVQKGDTSGYIKCTGSRTVCAVRCEMMQTLNACRSTKETLSP